jgi:hypothetical protein
MKYRSLSSVLTRHHELVHTLSLVVSVCSFPSYYSSCFNNPPPPFALRSTKLSVYYIFSIQKVCMHFSTLTCGCPSRLNAPVVYCEMKLKCSGDQACNCLIHLRKENVCGKFLHCRVQRAEALITAYQCDESCNQYCFTTRTSLYITL